VDSETGRNHRRRLEEMSIFELEDSWEEPMPDLVRSLLLTEIKRRNYRVQSLPR
jgi:hypothetical protein